MATEATDESPGDQKDQPAAELHSALASHGALPYLFIGSGIARRYLNLPDWEGLLRKFATDVGEDFSFHLATANGELPTAASSIARVFHPHWWKDAAYAEQRAKYSENVRDEEGGLRSPSRSTR